MNKQRCEKLFNWLVDSDYDYIIEEHDVVSLSYAKGYADARLEALRMLVGNEFCCDCQKIEEG